MNFFENKYYIRTNNKNNINGFIYIDIALLLSAVTPDEKHWTRDTRHETPDTRHQTLDTRH